MNDNRFTNRSELIGILVLAVFLVVILPLSLDVFRLNLVAKYLTYAFVALGLVICWGYGGILSLGQGVFFGLGGYCMAMFLKLEASSVENTKIQSTPGIPDFMDWNQITSLPLFWQPFHSLTFTILAIILVPGLFALIIGICVGNTNATPVGTGIGEHADFLVDDGANDVTVWGGGGDFAVSQTGLSVGCNFAPTSADEVMAAAAFR